MPRPLAAEQALLLRSDFQAKNQILAAYTQPLSPLEYYEFIFRTTEGRRLYVIENTTYGTASFDEIMDMASFRADIYVPPCDFFKDFYNLRTLSKLYALVVDIDNVPPLALEQLIFAARTSRFIEPTIIGNSGAGIHLYFVFSAPVDTYNCRKPILKAMARALGDMYRGYGRVDRNSLIQAYRLSGARTKLGDTMTGYRSGVAYDALELARKLGVDISSWEWVNTMQKPPKNEQETMKATPCITGDVSKLRWAKNGTKLWEYCTWRVLRDTPIGNRYTALTALAIVGVKCRVGREAVLKQLEIQASLWSERNPENPVCVDEVRKAMTMYSSKYGKVRAQQLEEYFGWTFERKIKRRPPNKRLNQKEHLRRCNIVKHALQADDKKQAITEYVTSHPGASQREVARETGLSRNTVSKFWPS